MARVRVAVELGAVAATIDVTVRGIAAGGAGVGELPDGRVVFVPRTAPGDRVSIRIERSKRSWATGSLRRIIAPSPERQDPPCPLYDRCGGCQLQHLPYERQLAWKGRIVADALERIGRLGDVEPPRVVASPKSTRYRNRLTFTLRRLRGGAVVAGFHALYRPTHVIDVKDECVLPRPDIGRAWRSLRAAWGPGARRLPAGGRLRLTVREVTGGVALVVEGGEPDWSAGELADAAPELLEIWHRPGARDSELRLVAGEPRDAQAPTFLQVNPEAAALLAEHVVEMAGSGTTAVDAYCGSGRYGHVLAERGWRVTGIEAEPAACRAATLNAPAGFSVLEGRVEDRLGEALPADLVIVNPPRSGLDPDVVSRLAERPVPRLVYVSCDPATLARDVGTLAPRYGTDVVRSFDLFPQTAHVETVLVMTGSGAGA